MSRRMKEKEEKFSSGASIERASDCLRHIFGKIKWSAFASLAVGLAILAAAGAIVRYATGDTNLSATGTGSSGFGDTFQESAADTY